MGYRIKNFLKRTANTLCLVIVLPLVLAYHVLKVLGEKEKCFWSISQFLSLFPGSSGSYIRRNFYHLTMAKCERNCDIMFGTIFSRINTEIGKGVYIGPNCNIGKCSIGDYCPVGSNVHIMSGRRQHLFDEIDVPVQQQGGKLEKLTIGEDTWIGNASLIMANVGKKCIVGAGSVVVKDIEDYTIVAGNPAKVIKKRS